MTNAVNVRERAGVLVVGTGEAGVRAATALRDFGYKDRIILLGDESHRPYHRPPLSKAFLEGRAGYDDLRLRTPNFYDERGIDVCPDRRVTGVEVDSSGGGAATCTGTGTIAFSRIVIATGARARSLTIRGADLEGVCTLRSIGDAESLRTRLSAAERVVIIGGGYIGLEAAAVTSSRGLPTTVVENEDRLLSRVSASPLSDFLLSRHREWGVEFELGRTVCQFAGDKGSVTGVCLDDGRILPADLVIVGIGAVPETALADALGLEVRGGIVVDANSRTSHAHVLAAGDCTVQPHPHLAGRLIRVESVQNANNQGRAAAATIVGAEPSVPPVPWFWSDQRNLKLQIAGISSGYDRYAVRRSPNSADLTVLYYRGAMLIAGESVNRPKDYLAVKRALTNGQTIPSEAAEDSRIELKELVIDV